MLARKIPVIPYAVNTEDLDRDFFLMSANDRALLQDKLDVSQNRRYTKAELNKSVLPNAKYSVMVHDGHLYILYKGEKRNGIAGTGTFSVVKYVQHIQTGVWYTLKIASKPHFKEYPMTEGFKYQHIKDSFSQECTTLKIYQRLRGELNERTSPSKEWQLYFMMDCIGTVDLFDYVGSLEANHTRPHLTRLLDIFWQMCELIKQIHIDGNLYRDVKLENYRIDLTSGQVKLVDFGAIVRMPATTAYIDGKMTGTILTIAPEALYECKHTRYSDIFSVGASIALILNILDTAPDGELRISKLYPFPGEVADHNEMVTDPEILRKLYYLCDDMMQQNLAARIELDEAQKRLDEMKQLAAKYPVSVKVVGVDAFDELTGEERNRLLFSIIHQYDEVAFFANPQYQLSPLVVKFMRLLQMAGVRVHDSVYLANNVHDVLRAIGREDLILAPIVASESEEEMQVEHVSEQASGNAHLEVADSQLNRNKDESNCIKRCVIL